MWFLCVRPGLQDDQHKIDPISFHEGKSNQGCHHASAPMCWHGRKAIKFSRHAEPLQQPNETAAAVVAAVVVGKVRR
jgi:hypothetical protein